MEESDIESENEENEKLKGNPNIKAKKKKKNNEKEKIEKEKNREGDSSDEENIDEIIYQHKKKIKDSSEKESKEEKRESKKSYKEKKKEQDSEEELEEEEESQGEEDYPKSTKKSSSKKQKRNKSSKVYLEERTKDKNKKAQKKKINEEDSKESSEGEEEKQQEKNSKRKKNKAKKEKTKKSTKNKSQDNISKRENSKKKPIKFEEEEESEEKEESKEKENPKSTKKIKSKLSNPKQFETEDKIEYNFNSTNNRDNSDDSENLENQRKKEEIDTKIKEKENEEKKLKEIKEREYAEKYPNGISCIYQENILCFVHFEINFKTKIKSVEIYDMLSPIKKGFKFIKYELKENTFFVVFPFYKGKEQKSVSFDIRDEEKNRIEPKHINFENNAKCDYDEEDGYKLELKKFKVYDYLQIYNINLEERNSIIKYIKQIMKMNIENFHFEYFYIREFFEYSNDHEIIEIILDIGKGDLSKMLINILKERKITIQKISAFIVKNKEKLNNKENYLKISSYIINQIYSQENETREENQENKKIKGRNSLLFLDKTIKKESDNTNYQKDLISDIIKDLENPDIKYDKEKIKTNLQNKIDDYNKKSEKKIFCVLTKKTIYKLYILELCLKANCPIIIQGFTSAGKSFLSVVASLINKMKSLSTVLSEHTCKEDLFGRDVINKDNSITFVPGILINAFTNGNILILNECDLANPEVLSSILNSLTENKIVEKNNIYYKMDGYNVILTMNGEAKGFEGQQRNILTSDILSKFIILSFDEMESKECEDIFINLLSEYKSKNLYNEYEINLENFINLHRRMEQEMKETKNKKSIDPIVTLRNLKYCCTFLRNSIEPRIAVEISYVARFPAKERKEFDDILNKFGSFQIEEEQKNKIIERLEEYNFIYDDNLIKSVFLSMKSIKEGLHILLIGKKGSGLTKLSKFIAEICQPKSISGNDKYKLLLCTPETSVDDLIGCYQPLYEKNKKNKNDKNKSENLTEYFEWVDGPVLLGGKEGVPVILDNINYSKPQIIERLNSLLEENPKYDNIEFNLNEKESEKPIKIKKNFIIIGTMRIDEDNKLLSKALMNRFVSIYIDEINININDDHTIEDIISKTINSMKKNISLVNENIKDAINNKNIELKYPKWYNVQDINLSQEDLKNLKNELKKEKFKNMKELVNEITKLIFIQKRAENCVYNDKCRFNFEDSYNLLCGNFGRINNDKMNEVIDKILSGYEENENNKYFFEIENNDNNNINNDARNMIINLTKCDLSNTHIFLQGIHGSGKSCAARHYGSHRKFNKRIPISTINCHKDLTFDYLVGNYSFQNKISKFVEGPLIIAMKRGEPILLDEFNLSPDEIYFNLLPILKANIGEKIYLKGVPYPIPINPGFLLIATGNAKNEKGRNIIPRIVIEEFNIFQIKNFDINRAILKKILEEEYKEIYKEDNEHERQKGDENEPNKISVNQTIEMVTFLSTKNIKLSLRQIKCLFDRIKRFCIRENIYNNEIEKMKKIPVIYVVISYIIPQLNSSMEMNIIKDILEKMDKIFFYNNIAELIDFVTSKVEILNAKISKDSIDDFIIKKGKLCLRTELTKKELPQAILQTYFWIRMSCSLYSENPTNENILLNGETSYKEFILNLWLETTDNNKKNKCDTYYLTQNTETQDLIGSLSLDDDEKIKNNIKHLIEQSLISINERPDEKEKVFQNIYDNYLKIFEANKNIENDLCLKYIKLCVMNLKKIKDNLSQKSKKKGINEIETIISFNLGIIPSCFIFGKKIILKGVDFPQPSVIERLNSILEFPRYLVLSEDNQNIFNNSNIFKELYYNNNKSSIPKNTNFSIFFTSRQINNGLLSEAFKSRCTIINCPNYENKNYLNINELKSENVYETIANNIIKDERLSVNIKKINKNLQSYNASIQMDLLKYIRWCNSAKNIYDKLKDIIIGLDKSELYDKSNETINYKYIAGITALRSVLDRLDHYKRIVISKECLKDFLPENLYILISKYKEIENEKEECPLERIEVKGKNYVLSTISGIFLEICDSNELELENIDWVLSSVDLADAILTSLISETILILEGPPGIGKTAISKSILEYLGIKIERINISPSTKKEDIFSRMIPKIEGTKISTEKEEQGLIRILRDSEGNIKYYKNGLLLDEINLGKEELLENIYSYLLQIFNKNNKNNDDDNFISFEGKKYNLGKLCVIGTMNNSKLSNSRTSLSNSFLKLCHFFKLTNYSLNEIRLLIQSKCQDIMEQKDINKIYNSYRISQEISNKYSDNNENTFREILTLKELYGKCNKIPIEYLLELIFTKNISPLKIEDFKKKSEEAGLKSMNNFINENELIINGSYLNFGDFIKYKIINQIKFDISEQFPFVQKESIVNILIGLLSKKPILLSGNIGCGKSYIIEKLSEYVGIPLNIIHFTSETTSDDLIGRLELSLNKEAVNYFNDKFNILNKELIEKEYEKICELIIKEEKYDSNLLEFLEKEKKNIPNENLVNEIIEKLKKYNGFEKLTFNFQESILLKSMEKGEWILLEDIHYAKDEIERLMSLLEENPTLTVYEKFPISFYYREEPNKEKNNYNLTNDNTNNIKIHDNFRIIITTTNESNISSAIRSRCLSVKIKPFTEKKDYSLIALNCLSNTNNMHDKNILELSEKIGNAYGAIKESEKKNNYILKNYIISPTNLVSFAKLTSTTIKLEENDLSNFIKLAFFSGFKEEKKRDNIQIFAKGLSENIPYKLKIYKSIKQNHEFYLSQCERNIISYYWNKRKNQRYENNIVLKEINKKSNKLMKNINEYSFPQNIKEENLLKDFELNETIRKNLLKNIQNFTVQEIKEYESNLNQVIAVLEEFLSPLDKLYHSYYFIKCLQTYINILISEVKDEEYMSLKICDLNSKNIKCWFINVIEGFEKLVPKNIDILFMKKFLLFLFYKYYFDKNKEDENIWINGHFLMLGNASLKQIMSDFEFIFNNKEGKIDIIFNSLLYSKENFKVEYNKDKEIEIIYNGENYNIHNKYDVEKLMKILSEKKQIKKNYYLQIKEYYSDNDYKYYYPKEFYKEENIYHIFWFYKLFLNKIIHINEFEIKEILPKELSDINENIDNFLKNKEKLWDSNEYRIINFAYKLLEGLSNINNNIEVNESLKFSSGIDLFGDNEEENIFPALEYINKIKNFFPEFYGLKNTTEILKNRKQYLERENFNKDIKRKIKLLNENFIKLKNNDNYKFFEKEIEKIKKDDKNINNKTKIEDIDKIKNKINKLNQQIDILNSAQNINPKTEKQRNTKIISWEYENENVSKSINIFYKYCNLLKIIENIKIIDIKKYFIHFVHEIQEFNKISEKNLFSDDEYRNWLLDNPIDNKENIIELLENISNAYLISKIVKTNIENIFFKEIKELLNIKGKIGQLIGLFPDNSFIYLPNLFLKNIEYCFKIGIDIPGYLNEFDKNGMFDSKYEENNEENNGEKYFENLEENLKKIKIKEGDKAVKAEKENQRNKILNYIKQIKELFNNYQEINYLDYLPKFNWLKNSLEELKDICLENPNKLIIKKKFGHLLNYNKDIEKFINKNKIIASALYATYEVQKKPYTKYFETPYEEIFKKIKFKSGKYSHRIMELYNLDIFRDDSSYTMILILDTVIDILGSIFSYKIGQININNELEELITELINETLLKEEPQFHNLKIINVIKIISQNIEKQYNIDFENKKMEIKKDIKGKSINLSHFIKIHMIDFIVKKRHELKEKYKKENENILKNKEYYKEKKNYERKINKKISDDEFISIIENNNLDQKIKYHINELFYIKKEIEKQDALIKILEELTKIKDKSEDPYEIYIIISKNNIHIGNELLDTTIYNNCKDRIDELNEQIKQYQQINKINDIKSLTEIKKLNDSNKLIDLKAFLLGLKNIDSNLFKINEFKDNNNINNIDNNTPIENNEMEKFLSKKFNFIFSKENNPTFLYNSMSIDLGTLFIECHNNEEIGSIIIPNSFNELLYYQIESNNNNYIYTDKEKDNKLEVTKDLKIFFNINMKKINEGLHESKFKIVLYKGRQRCDYCELNVSIFIIPLTLKFSLNKEKYSFDEKLKKISVNHYINNFKINHTFPGGIISESLGIILKKKSENEKIKIFNEKAGVICINSEEIESKFEFTLSLQNPLITFKMNFQKPKFPGLILFNKNFINIKEIKIYKGEEKKCYLFNMSNMQQTLKFSYDENKLKLTKNFEYINPGEYKEFKIKNENIINKETLKVNGISIDIENVEIENLWSKEINLDNSYLAKIVTKIRNSIYVKIHEINSIPKEFYSLYLVSNNELIMKQINFKYHYIPPSPKNYYFGFIENDNINEMKEFHNNKIIIANGDSPENSVFSDDQRKKFNDDLKENLNNLTSCDMNKIFESLSNLTDKEIKYEFNLENIIKNLELKNNDKCSIQNILIYLIKNFSLEKNLKDFLNKVINNIYKYRKIELYFYPNNKIPGHAKLFVENLSYIMSFILICLSPLELLPYEYCSLKNLNDNIDELKQEFENCFQKISIKDTFIKDIIYYKNKLFLHEPNDIFDQIENDMKNVKKEPKQNRNEQMKDIPDFSEEINILLHKASNNEINVSNLYKFLKNYKKYLIKFPLIFQKEKNENNIKNNIIECLKVYNYIVSLNNSPIYKSKFESIISKYNEEFESFLSQFSCFKLKGNKMKFIERNLSFIEKCSIPYDKSKYEKIEEKKEEKKEKIKDIGEKILSIRKNLVNEMTNNKNKKPSKTQSFATEEKKNNENSNKGKFQYNVKESILNELRNYPNIKELGNPKDIIGENRIDIPVDEIRKEQEKSPSISWLFERYMKIINKKGQKFSIINNEIKDVLIPFDEKNTKENNDFIKIYDSASLSFQNLISNMIREKIISFDHNNLLVQTLEKSYIDITIEITETMTLEQRRFALILVAGLTIPFSKYGCNIRISVFAEKECCWVLSDEFSNKNIELQLSRLRDVFSSVNRIQSFPADALKMLKQSFERKTYNGKYIQILISNLISAQVLDKNLDWNEIGQRIIVFGIKSNFEDEINQKYPDIYKKELLIPTSKKEQIIQQFFSDEEFQNNPDSFLKNSIPLIDTILYDLAEVNEEKNSNIKKSLINRQQKSNDNENFNKIIDKLIKFIRENQIDKKYFSQKISLSSCELSKYIPYDKKIEKQFENDNEFEELEKISLRRYENNSMNETIIKISDTYLNKFYNNYLIDNVPTKKVACSSGGSLSIPRIIKSASIGFSDTKIFEKLMGGKKKQYSILYAFDLSKSVLLGCNYFHTVTTILMLLFAPTRLDNVKRILIDIIINTKEGIKIVDYNSNSDIVTNSSKIEEIIYIIQNELCFSCNPGSCLNTAYQLLLEKRNFKKVFYITDGYINSKFEIKHALSMIQKFENDNIDLITIGVGSFPKNINYIFPVCAYSPQVKTLQDCLLSCLESSYDIKEIESSSLNNSFKEFQNLINIIKEKAIDEKLIQNINSRKASFLNLIVPEKYLQIETTDEFKTIEKEIQNPEEEPYDDGFFEGFNILIVILYLGNYEENGKIRDENITLDVFKKNAGESLKRKGFKYEIVCSYSEAIKEITKNEDEKCPYEEVWIFCSRGDGTLPEIVEDKEEGKKNLIPFLETVSEYNKKGGALLLFSDNYPFVLETNLLLQKYLKFNEVAGLQDGSAKFIMVGNYNNPNKEGKNIFVNEEKGIKSGKFCQDTILKDKPGEKDRLSLRVGIKVFNEGITLSYAKSLDKTNNHNYSPFTAFSCLSDKTEEKPFILYYDPIINKNNFSRGPIVVHGGFTSAFYDFKKEGTGRLVISIACWLARPEENYNKKGNKIQKIEPSLPKTEFNDWIQSKTMFSILILDVSGSMAGVYGELIKMTNEIIEKQMNNKINEGVVIFFANEAKTIIDKEYKKLSLENISEAKVGGGTSFIKGFEEAKKYIEYGKKFDLKRVLFLTDGEDSGYKKIGEICKNMKDSGYKLNIIGFKNSAFLKNLENYASEGCFYSKDKFKDVKEICINAFAADESQK